MTQDFTKPITVQPGRGDRAVAWSRRIEDAEGRFLGCLLNASDEFATFIEESVNANAYDAEVLADIEAREARDAAEAACDAGERHWRPRRSHKPEPAGSSPAPATNTHPDRWVEA